MKSSLGFAFVFILLAGGALAEPPEDKYLEWHKEMIGVRLWKKGCFKVTWPKKKWARVKCTTPLNGLYRTTGSRSFVGMQFNYSAEVMTGNIVTSIGSFVSGNVTSGSGNRQPANYSLQLNSQEFDTPACAGTKNPDCKGVQQFVYVPTITGGYIQYWLLNYRTADSDVCPEPNTPNRITNWQPLGDWNCTRYGEFGIGVPPGGPPIPDLTQLSLGGTAGVRGRDILTVRIGLTELWARNEDSVLHLDKGWRMAEFGVFGNGESSQVEFNPGTTLTVRTSVDNGTTDAPKCAQMGITGESNNLCLMPCSTYGGEMPAIVFTMSNIPNPAALCGPPAKSR